MNKSVLKIISICLAGVGLLAAKFSDIIAEKQMETMIDEKVEEKFNELNNKE